MALLPQDRQSQVMLLIFVAALAAAYFFWTDWAQPTAAKISAANSETDSLQVIIDKAKQDLASGTVEDLRRKVEQYQALLGVMRRLVPEKNEVPALIDDISTKSKVRGVTIGRFEPLAVESAQPFDNYRYRLEILGHYDQRGEAGQRRQGGVRQRRGDDPGARGVRLRGRGARPVPVAPALG